MATKINKKVFFKIHSWIGIKLSILFFIVCLSGTIATISHELDWLFNPDIRAEIQPDYASKNTMVQAVKTHYPTGKITFWRGAVAPYLCDVVYLQENGQRKYVFVNPYTGKVQGETTLTIQRYFRDLHYYLFIPFQVGHFTVLFFGFLLFISTVTALVFYKKWWRKLFDLKTGKGPVVLFRSLHRLVGIWSIPLTILFSITGMWYFLERANVASISDTANTKAPKIAAVDLDSTAFSHLSYTIDYDSAARVAQRAIPGLKVEDMFPPRKATSPLYLSGRSDVALVRKRANRVYLHPTTYAVIKVQKAEQIQTVTWLNEIADPLHFGYFGGLLTKIIWFFGGLGISFLVGTGIWISLKRKVRNARQAKAQRLGKWKYVNALVVLLMFGFMYSTLFERYAVQGRQFWLITITWVGLIYLAWFIYQKKINQAVKPPHPRSPQAPRV
ncbi:MAG: PepSY-associated TM helix domain-containing protein [Bacteroidota bacterium]